ncbi:MAG: hypothetical protein HOQ17_04670 [Gemmatimonadaceae bacterium]|nr:hypothetical protein [Gemmatimonadaceae bacterium]NUP57142.1 hypothetical protein [Gemmatimonadaceae bacterium]NUP70927.1 hypothetical protein [Gemmatimonadaceae bacterium]NUS32333.1 hypothetical protein [Gemmatimonadaceae bacterium]NUS49024.1 hypothetical protein [Gemmatimonadaceae bacterium]
MNRCVAIHSNGTSEVIDVHPRVHRELRGLGYRRFVIRTADGRSPLASAVYARITPTTWQITDAARKLWGRNTDAVHVFDEAGEPLVHDGSAPMTAKELHSIDAAVMEATSTPPIGSPVIPATPAPAAVAPSPPPAAADTRAPEASPPATVVTPSMLLDLRLAAREIRGLLASRPVGLSEANQLRALADRLESHAAALEARLQR